MQPGFNYNTKPALVPEQKVLFLQAFRETGNFSESAKLIGASRASIYNHLKLDQKFRSEFDAVINSFCDVLEQTMLSNGQKPNGFMDRMAYLRAHRPEKYNPRTTIVHESDKSSLDFLFRSLEEKGQIINVSDGQQT